MIITEKEDLLSCYMGIVPSILDHIRLSGDVNIAHCNMAITTIRDAIDAEGAPTGNVIVWLGGILSQDCSRDEKHTFDRTQVDDIALLLAEHSDQIRRVTERYRQFLGHANLNTVIYI